MDSISKKAMYMDAWISQNAYHLQSNTGFDQNAKIHPMSSRNSIAIKVNLESLLEPDEMQ